MKQQMSEMLEQWICGEWSSSEKREERERESAREKGELARLINQVETMKAKLNQRP
jgi:hypothetical protein